MVGADGGKRHGASYKFPPTVTWTIKQVAILDALAVKIPRIRNGRALKSANNILSWEGEPPTIFTFSSATWQTNEAHRVEKPVRL